MAEIDIRKENHVGRITLNRPHALNAITFNMCYQIEKAIDEWLVDTSVALIMIDAIGNRAFCAGGDLSQMYQSGLKEDYSYGHDFWRMEYRLNAKISQSTKPIVSFLNGYTMGGGVGLGCHGSHRIVDETSQIAMPECTIGLVPDVGGSYILSRNDGYLGEFLALTAKRLSPGDAIHCNFADFFVSSSRWNELKERLSKTGDINQIHQYNSPPPDATLTDELKSDINQLFGQPVKEIETIIRQESSSWHQEISNRMKKNSPLSMACVFKLMQMQRQVTNIQEALDREFRFTYRAAQYGDFIEGIRAQVIDKDYQPSWKHKSISEVPDADVALMLAPLGKHSLVWE